MTSLPTGTVAFLMSDIEGSTRLSAAAGSGFPALLDAHFEVMGAAVEAQSGTIVSTEGDSVFAVLPTARAAISAAVDAQRGLEEHDWPDGYRIRVRIGIHVGEAVFGGRDYTGIDVNKTARVMGAAWGGEILVSSAVHGLVGDTLDGGVTLSDLGSHLLRDIAAAERLYQVVAPGLRAEFPPPRTQSAAAPTNLPVPLTRFVGRSRELDEVQRLLNEARLVTLTGPGGTGKTRLAIEVGRASLTNFSDGVFFVALEAIRDPDLVLPEIAKTLGLTEESGRPIAETLAAYLAGRHLLLVLDNLEQVIEAAPLIAALLSAAPGFVILASSRESLGVAGERVYAVPTLTLPSEPGRPTASQIAGLEAVELFVERAAEAKPGFSVTDQNAPEIAAICRRLDGLPLAIELAAARVNVLSPAQILDRLDHRLTLLSGSRRDVNDRQRTLRGAITWSHELLSDPEKVAFRRFGVFVGGADLEAALAVINPDASLDVDALDLLSSLVSRSLLRVLDDASEPRFAMLETIREYAVEQLEASGEFDAIADRHADHFAAVAEAAARVLVMPDRDARLDRLDTDMPNFRTMFERLVQTGRVTQIARAARGLKDFVTPRNHLQEFCALFDRILRDVSFGGDQSARADLLAVAAELANWKGDYQRSSAWSTELIESLERLGDQPRLARAYNGLGWANLASQPEVARDSFERSTVAARQAEDLALLLGAQQGLAMALMRVGEIDRARATVEDALDLGERIGDRFTNSFNLMTLAFVELSSGNTPAAARILAEALTNFDQAGADVGRITALESTAMVVRDNGDPVTAARLALAAERLRQQIGGSPTLEVIGAGRILDQIAERDPDVYASVSREPVLSREDAIAAALAALEPIAADDRRAAVRDIDVRP